MSTSKPAAQGGIHTRLIPREEVQSVAPGARSRWTVAAWEAKHPRPRRPLFLIR